ncbi:MAG TPA: hypothetical protein VLV16_15765 [Gemmatimonadales bacterium]|nr:hypothetical protein [Gemmatimonadales bacterium]
MPLAAQQGGEAHLVLSAFAGVHAGRDLWQLPTQPVIAVQTTSSGLFPTTQHDTLSLGRSLASGIIAGASGAYFPNAHFGVEIEIALITESLESTCSIRQSQPPVTDDIDPELCASLQGQSISSSAVSFSAGVVGRLGAGRGVHPYARLDGGVVARTHSTIEMIGTYTSPSGDLVTATLVSDDNPSNTGPHVTAALGLAFSLGPGYQFRLEGRDIMMRLDAVTGPGDPSTGTLVLPHSAQFYHVFALTATLDVILERARKRRY